LGSLVDVGGVWERGKSQQIEREWGERNGPRREPSSDDDHSTFGGKRYWDRRYTDQTSFEWYCTYKDMRFFIYRALNLSKDSLDQPSPAKRSTSILVAGCGNSMLSVDMIRDGFTSLESFDISDVVIDAMKAEYPAYADKFHVMDMRNLSSYSNSSFDLVVDKGTLDALFCTRGSFTHVRRALSEISRVLKPNGWYLMLTYGSPVHRVHHFRSRDFKWSIYHTKIKAWYDKRGIFNNATEACANRSAKSFGNEKESEAELGRRTGTYARNECTNSGSQTERCAEEPPGKHQRKIDDAVANPKEKDSGGQISLYKSKARGREAANSTDRLFPDVLVLHLYAMRKHEDADLLYGMDDEG